MGWAEESRHSPSPISNYEELAFSMFLQQERERYETALYVVAFKCSPVWLTSMDLFSEFSINMVKNELLSREDDAFFDSFTLEQLRIDVKNGKWNHHVESLKNKSNDIHPQVNSFVQEVEDLQNNPLLFPVISRINEVCKKSSSTPSTPTELSIQIVENELVPRDDDAYCDAFSLEQLQFVMENQEWDHPAEALKNKSEDTCPPVKSTVREMEDPQSNPPLSIKLVENEFVSRECDTYFDAFSFEQLEQLQIGVNNNGWTHVESPRKKSNGARPQVKSIVHEVEDLRSSPLLRPVISKINEAWKKSKESPSKVTKPQQAPQKSVEPPLLSICQKKAVGCAYSNPLLRSFVPPAEDTIRGEEEMWKTLIVKEDSIWRWTLENNQNKDSISPDSCEESGDGDAVCEPN